PMKTPFPKFLRGSVLVLALLASSTNHGLGQTINSAHRMIFWVAAPNVINLSDAELDLWSSRGVGGFVLAHRQLRGMGGTQDFTGDPNSTLQGSNYDLQRSIRNSNIVGRANARGMKMYLSVYLVNYFNTATPLRPWFDDAGWSDVVIPRFRDLAGALYQLGFAGVGVDHELYPQTGGARTATWRWNFPGNTRTQEETRAQAVQRGQELMTAMLEVFPGVETIAYDTELPESWEAEVQRVVNGVQNWAAGTLHLDFLNGLSSVEGYNAIRLIDAIFYKTPHLGNWETANQYNTNRLYSLFSRRLSNWPYASSRLAVSPFTWIDPGSTPFEAARPPAYVATQLLAARKWGIDGEFANYTQAFRTFNYEPYVPGMQAATTPAEVDSEAPALSFTAPTDGSPYETGAGTVDLAGIATDNLAIRAVRWSNDRGGSGVAQMDWQVLSGNYTVGYNWQMNWSVSGVPLEPGANQITVVVEDIKGLTNGLTLTVNSGAPGVPAAPTDLTATAVSSSQIDLSWMDNSTDEDVFEIWRGTGDAWEYLTQVGADVTSYSDTAVAPGTAYSYYVWAFNAAGYSDASNEARTSTGPVPAAPSDLTATAVSSSQIDLSWTDNSVDEDVFEIWRVTGETWEYVTQVGADITSYNTTAVAPGTTYSYYVWAFNAAGYSDASNEASATTGP
ncbi:MAG: fibronectin type III domain-containing protein, partial [Verrucomicrobiota bacterium]|nr:fibronectin type III domain-containing protein [Verrucomicrobiota bacterium]